jgi:hypothetical protein
MTKRDLNDYAGSPRSEELKELREIANTQDKPRSFEKILRDADGAGSNNGLADKLPKP